MEASVYQSSTRLHSHESTIESTSGWHDHFPPERMDTPTYADRPECNGYIGRTNKRTRRWERGNEPRDYASRRIYSTRRIHTEGTRRRNNERSCRKRGFSTRLNPSAWVRAVHKFNSVIVTTRFRSMHIPVSIRTSNAMADIKALVDSGATDCFMSERFIRH